MLTQLISNPAFNRDLQKPTMTTSVIKHGFSLKVIALKNELSRLQKRREDLAIELSGMDRKIASTEERIKMIEKEHK